MATIPFYEDSRYCAACRRYVTYLASPLAAYCSTCGEAVRLFSPRDLEQFRARLHNGRAARERAAQARRRARASA